MKHNTCVYVYIRTYTHTYTHMLLSRESFYKPLVILFHRLSRVDPVKTRRGGVLCVVSVNRYIYRMLIFLSGGVVS